MTTSVQISDLARLPWPFSEQDDPFGAGTVTPVGGWGERMDLGPEHVETMALRAAALAADPGRVQVLPHMTPACWDVMLYLMGRLAAAHPESMELHRDGTEYRWINRLLGIDQDFLVGNAGTLPEHPLAFVGRQVPDDIALLSERDGRLWFDAVLVASSADRPAFDIGTTVSGSHWTVPGEDTGVLHRIAPGQAFRRVDWTFPAVDDMPGLVAAEDWGRLSLRIELEHLIRLPVTGLSALTVRPYTATLEEVASVPEWAAELAEAVAALSTEAAADKGIGEYAMPVTTWLRSQAGQVVRG